jgi:hypothetical protein
MPTAIESTTATRTHQKMQQPFKAIDLLGIFALSLGGVSSNNLSLCDKKFTNVLILLFVEHQELGGQVASPWG